MQPCTWNAIHLQDSSFSYINAYPITIADLNFIASNPPWEIGPYWRMTWDSFAKSITMLRPAGGNSEDQCTRCCLRNVNEVIETEDFRIALVEMKREYHRTKVCQLRISHSDQTKLIWHYAFLGWLDYGCRVGDDRAALLSLIKLSRLSLQANVPRIVHCSAGCGRTGTFIALDYLLEELERGALEYDLAADPVFETVDCLHEQRMMMVQKLVQYELIYDVLRAGWEDAHGVGGNVGSNVIYTFLIDGPDSKVKKPKWTGILKRGKDSSSVEVATSGI